MGFQGISSCSFVVQFSFALISFLRKHEYAGYVNSAAVLTYSIDNDSVSKGGDCEKLNDGVENYVHTDDYQVMLLENVYRPYAGMGRVLGR